jgi:hypothetical protein
MLSPASALIAVAAIFAGVLVLIAAVVVGHAAVKMIGLARASRHWKMCPGRVVRADILDGRPVIRYAYTVDGEVYEGRDVAVGDWPYRTPRSAANRARRYPVNAQVAVYYDPRQQDVAILKPGLSLDVFYLPVVASLLVFVALAFLSWGAWTLII